MTSYKVKENLNHNDSFFTKGEFVDLSEEEAKPLIEAGTIEPDESEKEETPEEEEPVWRSTSEDEEEVEGEKEETPEEESGGGSRRGGDRASTRTSSAKHSRQ
jgi:hypothetical protein